MVKKKSIKTSSNVVDAKEYSTVLTNIKKQVQETQVKAALAANKELAILYWSIGKIIAERQKVSGWGTKVIERLAKDLQNALPCLAGFSRTNVFRMKAFYLAYQNSPTAVGLLENDKSLTAARQIKSIDGSRLVGRDDKKRSYVFSCPLRDCDSVVDLGDDFLIDSNKKNATQGITKGKYEYWTYWIRQNGTSNCPQINQSWSPGYRLRHSTKCCRIY